MGDVSILGEGFLVSILKRHFLAESISQAADGALCLLPGFFPQSTRSLLVGSFSTLLAF